MTPPVTMKTIAREARVTVATVSLSLANHPRVSPQTREKILRIAQRFGYRPHPYLSTLMRARRRGEGLTSRPTLALVCCLETLNGWRNHPAPTIRQMREGAIERAAARGYRTQEYWLHRENMSNERFSAMLRARGIHGLLLSPLTEGGSPPRLSWEHFATVSLSVPWPEITLRTVCNDHYFSSFLAATQCFQRGYKRLGVVLRDTHLKRFQGRWESGVLAAGQDFPRARVLRPLYLDPRAGSAALAEWLDAERPDALITPSTETIPDFVATIRRTGRQVPQDLGLALLACPASNSEYSGIFQNGKLIGAQGIDALIDLVERHEYGLPEQATTLMVEGRWNEGSTLPARTVIPR